ncbi:RHS repeat-associated core domain-containing protein [Vibrio paucivorans]|uniref:F-box domain-containing protein n=1 Tax=Vibrio paucivorans TaxID=2829489 RepID=A0A9X3CIK6_9VIBR|nr:RHS repeat-associated core domain-containing protein [Vibrio paucivorans]MCW8336499.1 hypothetical protein [Vibrio paucivorans]
MTQISIHSPSRRRFIKGTAAIASLPLVPGLATATSHGSLATSPLAANPFGFNGERKDPAAGMYHLGNGYRMYNPRRMGFNAADNMSPFGKGGINSYAYGLGDPVNRRDPSGHFVILSMIIGAIVGAAISAAVEGIRAAVTHTRFDWKQVVIGAGLGLVGGGLGAAFEGASTAVRAGVAIAEGAGGNFIASKAEGASWKEAAISAGIGAVIGGAAFGAGRAVNKGVNALKKFTGKLRTVNGKHGLLASPTNAPRLFAASPTLEGMPAEISEMISSHLDDRSLYNLSQTSRTMREATSNLLESRRRIEMLSRTFAPMTEQQAIERFGPLPRVVDHLGNINEGELRNIAIGQNIRHRISMLRAYVNYLSNGLSTLAPDSQAYRITQQQLTIVRHEGDRQAYFLQRLTNIPSSASWYS